MVKGMTGFGSAQFSCGSTKGVVEVKSLNHRYLDIIFYLPVGFGAAEEKIRQAVSRALNRGRVTVSLKITDKAPAKVKLNQGVIKQYIQHAKVFKNEFGLENDLSLSHLIQLPGVVEVAETFLTPGELWSPVEKSLDVCLKSVVQMRLREGRSLAADIKDKLKNMSAEIRKIKARAQEILKQKNKELNDEEFASLQKSSDVNEEMSRLIHYVEEMRLLMNASAPSGKKMDFIAQEMQRETNTIGSKLQDAVVSNAVIALKSKIEKIREQSQNIE